MGDSVAGFPEARSEQEQDLSTLARKSQMLLDNIKKGVGETLDAFEETGVFEKRPLVLEERSFSDEEREVYRKYIEERFPRALEEAIAYQVYEKFKDDLPPLAPNIEDPYYYSENLPKLMLDVESGKRDEISEFQKQIEGDILDESLKTRLYQQSLKMLQMSLEQTVPQLEEINQQAEIGPLEEEMLENMQDALLRLSEALQRKASREELKKLYGEIAGEVDGLKQALHRHKMEGIMGDVWMGDEQAEAEAKKYQESLQVLFQEELLADAPYRKAAADRLDPAIQTFQDLTIGEFFNQLDRTVESTVESARDTRESLLSVRDQINDLILEKVRENVPTTFGQGLVLRILAIQDFDQDAERIQERIRKYFEKIQVEVQKPEFQRAVQKMDGMRKVLGMLEQAQVQGMTLAEAEEKLGDSLDFEAKKALGAFTEEERHMPFEELVPRVFAEYQEVYDAFTKSAIEIQKPLLLEAWLDIHDELSMFPPDTNLARTTALDGKHLGRLTQYYMPDIIRQGMATMGLMDPQIRAELKSEEERMEEWFKNEKDREKTQNPKPIYRVLRKNTGDQPGYTQVELTWSKLTEEEKKELFYRLNVPEGVHELTFDSPWDEESFPQFLGQVGVTGMGIGGTLGAGYGVYRALATKGILRKGVGLLWKPAAYAARGATWEVAKQTAKLGGRIAIKFLGKMVAKIFAALGVKAAVAAGAASTGIGVALGVGLAVLTAYEAHGAYKTVKRLNLAKDALEDIFDDDLGSGDVVEHDRGTIEALAGKMKADIGLDYPDASWSRIVENFMTQRIMPQQLLEWVASKGGDAEKLGALLSNPSYTEGILKGRSRRTEHRKMADGREAKLTWNGEELTYAYIKDKDGKEHTLTGDEVNDDMDFKAPDFSKKNVDLKTMEGMVELEGVDLKGLTEFEAIRQARMIFMYVELTSLADKCKFSSMNVDIPEEKRGREIHISRFDLPVDKFKKMGVTIPLVVRANPDYTSFTIDGLDQTYDDFYQAGLAANMMLKQLGIMWDHNTKGDGSAPFERGGGGIDYDKAWKFWDLRVLSGDKEALPWYRDVIGIDRDKFIEIFNEYYREDLHNNEEFWALPDK